MPEPEPEHVGCDQRRPKPPAQPAWLLSHARLRPATANTIELTATSPPSTTPNARALRSPSVPPSTSYGHRALTAEPGAVPHTSLPLLSHIPQRTTPAPVQAPCRPLAHHLARALLSATTQVPGSGDTPPIPRRSPPPTTKKSPLRRSRVPDSPMPSAPVLRLSRTVAIF